MIGKPIQNLGNLFRNTRTRTIIIITGAVIGFALVIGLVRLMNQGGGPASTATVEGPGTIESVPGGFGTPETAEYARLQEQQNAAQVKTAERRGTSAIPTIISSGELQQGEAPPTTTTCGCPCPGTAGCPGVDGCPGVSTAPGGLPFIEPSRLQPGTLVYNGQHRVIGTIGPDGKVRDVNARDIGTVAPDSLVRDMNSTVIGAAGSVATGTPVFDLDGKLLGSIDVEGKVQDSKSKQIGTVCPDGTVRNANGNSIGKAGDANAGTPVYDAQGHLIGYVGPDGKVRDLNGNVIGTVGPDGIVRDANGNIIGKTGALSSTNLGTPIYDSQGRLIGYAGPDGKVRDLNGNVIGTLGPDGLVRDAKGNVIGKAGGVVAGTPICDANGKVVGFVGPDGKVRDENGNIVGTVGPDGVASDVSGKIIGKTCRTITGTPIYDAQGRLIGIAGPDGKLRDANGRVIGTVGLDGVARDAQGNIIGNVAPPGAATSAAIGLPTGTPTGLAAQQLTLPGIGGAAAAQQANLQLAMQRQAQLLSDQKAQQLLQQTQSGMAGQAGQLLSAWAPVAQAYVVGNPPTPPPTPAQQAAASAAAAAAAAGSGPPAAKAGTVMCGILITAVNSDEPGPILGTIVEGAFKGARLLGSITNQGQTVMLTFTTMTLPNIPRSISINAVAIDQNSARTALSTSTNNHYILRYGTLFASSFLEGYAQALSTSGSQVISTGLSTQTSMPNLSAGGKFMVALGNVGNQYSARLGAVFNTPPTVYVKSGTAMGVLFLADVPPLPTS